MSPKPGSVFLGSLHKEQKCKLQGYIVFIQQVSTVLFCSLHTFTWRVVQFFLQVFAFALPLSFLLVPWFALSSMLVSLLSPPCASPLSPAGAALHPPAPGHAVCRGMQEADVWWLTISRCKEEHNNNTNVASSCKKHSVDIWLWKGS